MKTRILITIAVLFLALCAPLSAQPRYILRTNPGAAANVAARHGLSVLKQFRAGPAELALLADPSSRAADLLRRSLRSDPTVINFELDAAAVLPELNQSTVAILDGIYDTTLTTYYGGTVWSEYTSQPAVSIIQLGAAHTSYASGAGVVAVIDTGVDPLHPVLSGSLVAGYDFTRNLAGGSELLDVSPTIAAALALSSLSITNKQAVILNQSTVAILDQSTVAILDGSVPPAFGHGTMVSGLVHLAAPRAKIMPLKAFSADGTASLFNILQAVYFAVDNGAKAINMSFSMSQPSDELLNAITYANAHRVVSAASVGNSGLNVMTYPAGWTKVLGTASTSNTDVRSSFSNYGPVVEVGAPGEGLITAYPGNNYAEVWGTSFSAALVSGGAGLLAQLDPNIGQDQATAALSQALYLGPDLGAGRIDLYRACRYWAIQKGLQ